MIVVVAICGKTCYLEQMYTAAKRYTEMGCIVHFRFDQTNTELTRGLHKRRIEVADIVHIVQFRDLDEMSYNDLCYARALKKAITYAVPRLGYLRTFYVRDDTYIEGPLHWVPNHDGYRVADANNKIVPIETIPYTEEIAL